MKNNHEQMSKTRKVYWLRFWGRSIIVTLMLWVYLYKKEAFDIAKGWNFFEKFTPFHLLWGIWMWDMILQLIPVKAHISIGSQKIFASLFKPIKEKISKENLKKYLWDTTRSAYIVMLIWIVMNIVIGYLYLNGIIDVATVFMIPVVFYLCDLICVLIWCPFRLIVKTKCCTTCRIFNWDHLMMFSPFTTVTGFYSWTLLGLAIVIWIIWEVCVFTYPERFWENSNMALRCSECTDKLCTQYCRKLRK